MNGTNKPENIIDGSKTTGNGHNWYDGTKCLITYNYISEISSIAVYDTEDWGNLFSNATIYYSNDDSLTLQSDLSQFDSISIRTGDKRTLANAINAKRIMLVKPQEGAVCEFECYGLY